MEDILYKYETGILREEQILFEPTQYECTNKEHDRNFKLYILKVKDKFIVYSGSYYCSDDDFISFLESSDRISHPISLNFYREFEDIKKATEFFEKVLSHCPEKLDVMNLIDKKYVQYLYDSKDSIHYDFKLGRIKHNDWFEKEFIRHGYQRILIRMFRIKNYIVINKHIKLEFDNEEDSKLAFSQLKNHYSESKCFKIPYKGEEMKFNKLFEKFIDMAFKCEDSDVNVKRDKLGRVTELKVAFRHKGLFADISFELARRNGYYHGTKIDASIYISDNSEDDSIYETYRQNESFAEDLEKLMKKIKHM